MNNYNDLDFLIDIRDILQNSEPNNLNLKSLREIDEKIKRCNEMNNKKTINSVEQQLGFKDGDIKFFESTFFEQTRYTPRRKQTDLF